MAIKSKRRAGKSGKDGVKKNGKDGLSECDGLSQKREDPTQKKREGLSQTEIRSDSTMGRTESINGKD